MVFDLIIAEKPSAAKKIAFAVSESKVDIKKNGQVSYFVGRNKEGKDIFVVPAVGHLFGLKQKGKGFDYPVFDIEWRPTYEIDKKADYSKKYLNTIKKICKKDSNVIIATDFDIEGETIGYNILRFVCGRDKALRMKFSTLTKKELKEAYLNPLKDIVRGVAEAGETRHYLDYYFGINLSRALMNSLRKAGRYKTLSIGRVQGPALYLLTKREREIMAFKPEPYWNIFAHTEKVIGKHIKGNIFDKEVVDEIKRKVKGHDAIVKEIKVKEYKHNPPTPFNLTDLQVEAHRVFKMSPRKTQEVAQQLYEMALISYPRTSSQKLPAKLGLKSILEKLAKIKKYKDKVDKVLSMRTLKPNEGKKKDEAHPAIHPTGEMIKEELTKEQMKIYDLIVKRFIATFGKPAIRESMKIKLDINEEVFLVEGSITKEKNWYELYEPYVSVKDEELPKLKEGETLKVRKIEVKKKETKPPSRYTESSLIRLLEKENLGTKATRATVIGNLYDRGYIEGKQIKVTKLGLKVVDTLEKYSPEILSPKLTRKFEEEMEKIKEGKLSKDKVLKDAEIHLVEILGKFKKKEGVIGKELIESVDESEKENNTLGKCPKCGGNLIIMRSKKGSRFVGCSNYPKCKNIYPLPRQGIIRKTDNVCEYCHTPIIQVYTKGKKAPWTLCLDPNCETKKRYKSNNKEM